MRKSKFIIFIIVLSSVLSCFAMSACAAFDTELFFDVSTKTVTVNTSRERSDTVVCVAAYKEKSLVDIKLKNEDLKEGQNTVTFSELSLKDADRVKVFALENLFMLKPVSQKTEIELDDLTNEETMLVVSENRFDGQFDTENAYIDVENGEIKEDNAKFKCATKYMSIWEKPVEKVFVSISQKPKNHVYVAFYDSNKNLVSYVSANKNWEVDQIVRRISEEKKIKYFRVSADKEYSGKIYVSPYDPGGAEYVNYEYKEEAPFEGALKGKTIVNFGDSIFGNYEYPNDVSAELERLTGATTYNCAFGGTRMGKHSLEGYAPFSMYCLAEAVVSGDWSDQEKALTGNGLSPLFEKNLNTLKSIDFSSVDIVTIALGTNDFTSGMPCDRENDKFDVSSFGGGLRTAIKTIKEKYPHIEIYVCSPIYRFWMDDNGEFTDDSETRQNTQELTLKDYGNKAKEIAAEFNVSYIDNYNNSGINKDTYQMYFKKTDGTHPRLSGRKAIAQNMAKELCR